MRCAFSGEACDANGQIQVLFKSSRVIGVMIGGIFILGKRYHPKEYLGVFFLAVGLVIFTLGDIQLQADFHPVGKCI